jgi:hypothetical protein
MKTRVVKNLLSLSCKLTDTLRTLSLDNTLASECKRSDFWSAVPHTKLESVLLCEILQISRLSPSIVAQNSVSVQGHIMLKSVYE